MSGSEIAFIVMGCLALASMTVTAIVCYRDCKRDKAIELSFLNDEYSRLLDDEDEKGRY